jgi:hypothetical protein
LVSEVSSYHVSHWFLDYCESIFLIILFLKLIKINKWNLHAGDIDKNPLVLVSRTGMVHVDDVARAHIFLLEHPNPKGRYNCSPFIATIDEIVHTVSSKYPKFKIPTSK